MKQKFYAEPTDLVVCKRCRKEKTINDFGTKAGTFMQVADWCKQCAIECLPSEATRLKKAKEAQKRYVTGKLPAWMYS